MKKIVYLITFLALIVACSNENSNSEGLNAKQKLEFSAKNFVNSTIAYDNKGEITFGVTKDELYNSFNAYATKFEIGSHAESYLIEDIDGKNYIRFYHKSNNGLEQVSTIALIKNKNKDSSLITYRSGRTVCTTIECANCCGCIPDGDYCTKCEIAHLDCKRTTTGGSDPISE
ncbi:hypothetical protein [Psychroserpens ponticola]|uniref:Lipoprotein n=1 Tax=Psychroserpens ponticola TaxID=2932268 RepID=A0ABY7S476_9FLAO|nr:hypothetical protein [Psychroserpens ponticola]WCO03241.1 hypothetical protein MUN68_007015 [Psychroserpens ponticola]